MSTTITASATPAPEALGPRPPRRGRAELRDLRTTLLVVATVIIACAIAVVIGMLTFSSGGPTGDVSATTVDFSVHMPTMLDAGRHTIVLTNRGKTAHELVMFRTDLPAAELPLGADGDVNEDAPQLASVADSGAATAPGASKAVQTENLSPGHYVTICNLSGHYKLGMHIDVTVK